MKLSKSTCSIGIWVAALLVFYLTVGVIVSYVILEQIALAINSHATLFDEWYQVLLFVLDIIAVLVLVASITLYFLTSKGDGKHVKKDFFYSVFNRTTWGGLTCFFAILTVIAYVGNSIALQYQAQINSALHVDLYKKVDLDNGETADSNYFPSDYYYTDGRFNDAGMREHSEAVAEEAANESTVLMWNNNNALPLAEHSKIGVFGMNQLLSKYHYTGTGSGYLSPILQNGLVDVLSEGGFDVFKTLNTAYKLNSNYGWAIKTASMVGVSDSNYSECRINEVPWAALDGTAVGSVTTQTDKYEDAAIVLLGRYGGETLDLDFTDDASDKNGVAGDDCYDGNYLDLSANEVDVLNHLTALKQAGSIKKIILVINSDNAIQFKHIKDYDIDACLWVGMGGNASYKQITNALNGASVPSGRLVDTYVYDNYSAPASVNFGDFTFTESSDALPETHKYTWNTKYLTYSEGIYVGYRYYETRYEDAVLGRGNANGTAGVKAGAVGSSWSYTDEVAYPYGYGLSYTNFSYSDFQVYPHGENYDIFVTVKNEGEVYSGKETVQIYLQKPYTDYDKQNGIEKSAVDLVGFAKTKVLAPGASQTLTISVKAEELKCYDSYGKKTYILEQGDYYLAAGRNAHDALNNVLAKKGKTVANGMDYDGDANLAYSFHISANDYTKYSVSTATGKPVSNLFDNADINLYEGTKDQHIQYLSRNDWNGTYPTPVAMKCVNATMVADMQYGVDPVVNEGDKLPIYGQISAKYGKMPLISMMDVDYYDTEMWDEFMNQTTWEEQCWLVTYGSHVLAGAESVSAPGGKNQNGPSGLNQANPTLGTVMAFPSEVNLASTFNVELVERVGDAFGMEMIHAGYTSLNGLGADIHRTAFSGRNWEYYSEDSFMTGAMLAAQSKGLQSRGIILFTKHCLMNDQERNRYGVTTWANEQTIREIYAKGFEIAVVEENLNGVMSSFNRLGCVWAGRHAGLLNGLLREEWGFTGTVETDAAVGAHMLDVKAMVNAVCAGQDLWLWSGSKTVFDDYKTNPTVALAIREAARHVLYSQLHANAMNGTTINSRFVSITPWWMKALVSFEVVSTAILVFAALMFAGSIFVNGKWNGKEGKKAEAGASAKAPERTVNFEVEPPMQMGEPRPQSEGSGVAKEAATTLFQNKKPRWIISIVAGALSLVMVATCIIGPAIIFSPEKIDLSSMENTPTYTPVDPGVETHECSQTCFTCGHCLDPECEESTCAVKCGDDKAHVFRFEAENTHTLLTKGSLGSLQQKQAATSGKVDAVTGEPVGYIGNFNQNNGAKISFPIHVEEAETVSLYIRISSYYAMKVTDLIFITVNDGAAVDSPVLLKNAKHNYFYFVDLEIGCIDLKAGDNTVNLISVGKNGANVDAILIKSNGTLTYTDGASADVVDGTVQ